LLFVVTTVAGCDGRGQRDIPAPAHEALAGADEYELLALDPADAANPPPDHFHGWRVLGRTSITDAATRKKLNDALRAGARAKDISPMACFDPRHGIRVTRDGRIT